MVFCAVLKGNDVRSVSSIMSATSNANTSLERWSGTYSCCTHSAQFLWPMPHPSKGTHFWLNISWRSSRIRITVLQDASYPRRVPGTIPTRKIPPYISLPCFVDLPCMFHANEAHLAKADLLVALP